MEFLRRLFGREQEQVSEPPKMDKWEDIDRRVLWFFTDTKAVRHFGPDGRIQEIDNSQIVYSFPSLTVTFKEASTQEENPIS